MQIGIAKLTQTLLLWTDKVIPCLIDHYQALQVCRGVDMWTWWHLYVSVCYPTVLFWYPRFVCSASPLHGHTPYCQASCLLLIKEYLTANAPILDKSSAWFEVRRSEVVHYCCLWEHFAWKGDMKYSAHHRLVQQPDHAHELSMVDHGLSTTVTMSSTPNLHLTEHLLERLKHESTMCRPLLGSTLWSFCWGQPSLSRTDIAYCIQTGFYSVQRSVTSWLLPSCVLPGAC